eukprot:508294-Rhodomonas_salina.2
MVLPATHSGRDCDHTGLSTYPMSGTDAWRMILCYAVGSHAYLPFSATVCSYDTSYADTRRCPGLTWSAFWYRVPVFVPGSSARVVLCGSGLGQVFRNTGVASMLQQLASAIWQQLVSPGLLRSSDSMRVDVSDLHFCSTN